MGGPYEGQPGPVEYCDQPQLFISDDTHLTVATCESVAQAGSASPEHIAANFARWFRERRITGIGSSTLKALRDLDAGQHWALSGAKGEMAAGNGAAMRVAPLAFILNPNATNDRRTLRDICRITHHSDEAYIGALAVVLAVHGIAFCSATPGDLLSYVVGSLPDSRVRDRLQEIDQISDEATVLSIGQRFGCSGYVVDSVPLALYAAQWIATLPILDVLRNAIAPGGDTDTIASITGQIAGTAVGLSRIPADLLQNVSEIGTITNVANKYAGMVADAE